MKARGVANKGARGSELDLGALHIFVSVARAGSFVSGGRAMGLSRSAAGKALARLEDHLGTRLFHRTTRRLSLTSEGHEFYHRCRQILEDVEEAEASVRQNGHRPSGILRLTVSEGYARSIVVPYLCRLLNEAPDLMVEMSVTDRVHDLVEEGVDLAIRVGHTVTNTDHVTQVIDRVKPELYASPAYLEQNGTPHSPFELKTHRRLVYGLGTASTAWQLFDRQQGSVRIDGSDHARFDSGETIRSAAVSGMGICYLPAFMTRLDVQNGTLVPVLPDSGGEDIAIHAIYPGRRYLPLRVRTFIDGLRHFLNE